MRKIHFLDISKDDSRCGQTRNGTILAEKWENVTCKACLNTHGLQYPSSSSDINTPWAIGFSCNGCDAVDMPLDEDGYCKPCVDSRGK